MSTKISACSCKHKYQDDTYGKGRRVMNVTTKQTGTQVTVRCTVCKKEKQHGK